MMSAGQVAVPPTPSLIAALILPCRVRAPPRPTAPGGHHASRAQYSRLSPEIGPSLGTLGSRNTVASLCRQVTEQRAHVRMQPRDAGAVNSRGADPRQRVSWSRPLTLGELARAGAHVPDGRMWLDGARRTSHVRGRDVVWYARAAGALRT